MDIQIDTKEKACAIKRIIAYFDEHEIRHYGSKLYVGDYMNLDNPRLIIDRKQNLREIYSNLCHDSKRFKDELKRAGEVGIKLIFLCEHSKNIKSLEDVKQWYNPQLDKSPYAWDGEKLFKEMKVTALKYDVEWRFCDKGSTGAEIVRLLS